MWIIFGILLIGFLLLLLALCSLYWNWDITSPLVFWGVLLFTFGISLLIPVYNAYIKDAKKEQCIELLLKENPYEMVIQYELKDSLYVPVDTIFVLKEKK